MRVKDLARDCAEATYDNGNHFSLAEGNLGYRAQLWPPTTRGLTESTLSNRNNFNTEPVDINQTYVNNTENGQDRRSIILNQNIGYCSNTAAALKTGDEIFDNNCFVDCLNSRNSNIEFCKSTEFFVGVDNVNDILAEQGGRARSAPSPDESLEYEDIDHCSSATTTPLGDEDRAFEHSDTDDNHSDYDNAHTLPRGIVNPNYPGFQHLAHTLENFTSRGDHNYHSETELTDDDIDINSDQNIGIRNVIESNYYSFRYTEYENNNNNNNSDADFTENYVGCVSILDYDKKYTSTISPPELSNRVNIEYENENYLSDVNSVEDSTTNRLQNGDENYFITNTDSLDDNKFLSELTTDNIVGDFETEVVKELNCIVDRNSNFNDDLVALQKEINETIKKPIEVTIQNVSEVFDTVIEKLVEAQNYDQSDNIQEQVRADECTELVDAEKCDIDQTKSEKESTCIDIRNDKPVVPIYDIKDMELSAPSFLCLGNDFEVSIDDAYLSDSKDEITPITDDSIDACRNSDAKNYNCDTKCQLKICTDLHEGQKSEKYTFDNVNQNVSIPVTKDTNLNTIEDKQTLALRKSTQSTVKAVYKYNAKRNKEKLYETICEKEIDTKLSAAEDGQKSKTKKSKENPEPVTARNGARPRTADVLNRRSVPQTKHTSRSKYSYNSLHGSHVYSLHSTASAVDLDNIENHLRIAKEEDRRRRNDREEIRRRLAMGTDPDDYRSYHVDRPGRKPSLQTRLQSGMNLQICFMNETASDNESPNSDGEGAAGARKLNTSTYSLNDHPYQTRPLSVNIQNENQGGRVRPSSLSLRASTSRPSQSLGSIALTEADFFARQARLQTEARMALAQAKEMARIQMEQSNLPVTDMLRRSLQKANAPLPLNRRRVSRQILTDMNVAQLQVIVNELHTQIENLNESLVKMLMARDELHMGQDSMLVDIEDLTRYLGAKEQGSKNKPAAKNKSSLTAPLPVAQPPPRSILAAPASAIKPKLHRFVSLVRK